MEALRTRPPEVFIVGSKDRFLGLAGSYEDSATLLRSFHELSSFLEARYAPVQKVGRYSVFRLQQREGPPDLIVISIDTLRPDRRRIQPQP